jgi:hypothetical protein
LAVALGAPALAHAQQGGLFPLAPIRRERVPCAAEDPVYRLYRHEYFGYHPTCWRRFPAGWGCPSPEAPNAAAEFEREKLQVPETPPAEPGPETEPGAGREGEMAPGRGGPTTPSPNVLPPLPPAERSPFDLDIPAAPRPGRPAAPGGDRPAAPEGRAPNSPGGDAGAADAPRVRDRGGPDLTPPAPNPPGGSGAYEPSAPGPGAAADQPLLALPDPTVNPSAVPPATASVPLYPGDPGPSAGQPAQAPSRPSLLSNLFNGRLFRRR